MTSATPQTDPRRFVSAIAASGLSIYDKIKIGDPRLWIPTLELEMLLNAGLCGVKLAGLPLRTRSKMVKEQVCHALGYPVPASFKKTKPRFPGQIFDTYVQKSSNLQVWNEELAPTRRYAIIRVNEDDVITIVKVVRGDTLAKLDTTGTLTQKYQARCIPGTEAAELVVTEDTALLRPFVSPTYALTRGETPVMQPAKGQLLPIATLYDRLRVLLGRRFANSGIDQERNRGASLHRRVCKALGYAGYQDDGQFPDVRHQLLEIKLQTSPTIDLGLVTPSGNEPLDVPQIGNQVIRHCDVRYAVFYARTNGKQIEITHLFVTTGEMFFTRFPQFQGKVLNKKLQIPLPADFFQR
ncbi:MAG: restriction endonuclease [Phycisphaeraceae bacterium]|nr:restriction endonuclease [Phycisphaeraceae bacterium]